MNSIITLGNIFSSILRGIIPSALRDCSTYQFRCVADDFQVTALSELEFH